MDPQDSKYRLERCGTTPVVGDYMIGFGPMRSLKEDRTYEVLSVDSLYVTVRGGLGRKYLAASQFNCYQGDDSPTVFRIMGRDSSNPKSKYSQTELTNQGG